MVYLTPRGTRLRDAATLARIRRLAIPPAWVDVWICPSEHGHLQATGRDRRGRKQYRYHADWRNERSRSKFEGLRTFGQALPRIRRQVNHELARPLGPGPTRERVLAALVRLLDRTGLRIGNAEYLRSNHSYGLSTLHNRHAQLNGDELRLSFVGKGGVHHEARVSDRRVARLVRRCRELPGQALFQYVSADGGVHGIDSGDVNAWLSDVAGARVTAKDFRTWHGSVLALELTLAACVEGAAPCTPQEVLSEVARHLGNTPAVCRTAYVHPRVLELGTALADDAARATLRRQRWVQASGPPTRGLSAAERSLLGLLRRRAAT
jgi:DNA topoisomerase-1